MSANQPPIRAKVVAAVTCPSCGKLNPESADWCWVCHGAINAEMPTIDVRGAASQEYLQDDAYEADKSRRRGTRRTIVGTGLAVIGGTLAAVGATLAMAALAVLAAIYSFFAAILEICSGGP